MADHPIRRKLRDRFNLEGKDVFDFHNKFLVPMAPEPSFLDKGSFDFRLKFMQEELDEFRDGHNAGDMHEAADSLVDLAYVVYGTALMMGLPWDDLWAEVQMRNMQKRRAKNDGSDSKRGSPLDVIKPEGWSAPDHTDVLGAGPWPVFDASAVNRMTTEVLLKHPDVVLRYDDVTGCYIVS